tara:strand:+ start:685 stop:999 length:315 start_codon:yes stop_codon:yes gene_type:complete
MSITLDPYTDDLPSSPYYVTATDTYCSGWGGAANKLNRVILPCESQGEAEVVADNARSRSDMADVTVHRGESGVMPVTRGIVFSLMGQADAARWYEPGGFGGQR